MTQQTAISDAIDALGGKRQAAEAIGVTYTAVLAWLADDGPNARPLPLERAMQIERLLNGKVTREQLRPDVDWSRPEVADRKAA